MLIAMSLFSVVSTIAATVLVDVVQLQKKSSIQNEIYEDARILMQQLTNEIQSGTIDYEEYYSVNVVQQKNSLTDEIYYGINYGVYSSRFFDPGKSIFPNANNIPGNPVNNPDDLGIECSYPADDKKTCEIYFSDSTDLNTGQNPYKNNPDLLTATDANAVYDRGLSAGVNNNVVPELYLIDSSGTHKTIIAKKNMTSGKCGVGDTDCAIGMMRMTGQDMDQNGITDVFSCDSDYKCTAAWDVPAAFQYPFIKKCAALLTCDSPAKYLENNKIHLPRQADLVIAFDPNESQFVPITPRRANIKSLNFTINPLDDPYKAYAESAMQTQPTVTISMTIGLANSAKSEYPGTFPDITLQTTVTAGVIGKIDSYPPVNDILRKSDDLGWINGVF